MSDCSDVVVVVRGGNVSQVYARCESIQVVVVDWDNAEASEDASYAWHVSHAPLSQMPPETKLAATACQRRPRS